MVKDIIYVLDYYKIPYMYDGYTIYNNPKKYTLYSPNWTDWNKSYATLTKTIIAAFSGWNE